MTEFKCASITTEEGILYTSSFMQVLKGSKMQSIKKRINHIFNFVKSIKNKKQQKPAVEPCIKLLQMMCVNSNSSGLDILFCRYITGRMEKDIGKDKFGGGTSVMSGLGMLNKPLQCDVYIIFLFT